MELPLEHLADVEIDGTTFQVAIDREATTPWPVQVTATGPDDGERLVLDGRTNPGTSWRHPWLEARYISPFPEAKGALPSQAEARFFSEALPGALVPAAYVMLSCDGHADTLSALTTGVPPPATGLGYRLWLAGARWYKVWYYPEGWREGHEKLQGNLPADDAHHQRATTDRLEELEAFLDSDQAAEHPACRERARAILGDHDR